MIKRNRNIFATNGTAMVAGASRFFFPGPIWGGVSSQAAAMKEHRMAMELHSLDELGRKELARRVSEMQRKHAMAVMTLTTQEERLAYVQGIPAEVIPRSKVEFDVFCVA